MIKLAVKMIVWLAVGFAIVSGAVRLDIDAASPWQYQVTTSGESISVKTPGSLDQIAKDAVADASGELGSFKVEETLDAGVLGFLVALYGVGTLMGMLLRGRKDPGAPTINPNLG